MRDAITNGPGRPLADQQKMDQFFKKRTAFRLVAINHVHHLVIAGIAVGLVKRAMAERRTQKDFLPVLTDKILVGHARFRREGIEDFFKTFVLAVKSINDPWRDDIQNGVLLFLPVALGFEAKLEAFKPVPYTGQVGLDVSNQHFELRRNAIVVLPVLKKNVVGLLKIGSGFRRR